MGLGITSRSFRRTGPGKATVIDGLPVLMIPGKVFYAAAAGAANQPAETWDTAESSIQRIHDNLVVSARGDAIIVGEDNFDEAVTITKSGLYVIGTMGRGSATIAPTATNGIAITISGTAAARCANVTLINIGGEGNGTGGGLHVKGNIRRFRAYGCKLEGGAFAAKFESTAAGSVGDVWLDDDEFAWATDGIILTASGGGDPTTSIAIGVRMKNLFHNITTDCIRGDVSHHTNIQVVDNVFDASEAGTEPTQYIDLNVASSTGIITGNRFPVAAFTTAKFAIASGVRWVGNYGEGEGPATGGGTGGRPD